MSVKPFTSAQQEYINRGKFLSSQLSEQVLHALGKSKLEYNPKRHHYIASTPGAGKTYTVAQTASKHKIDLVKIQGVASMNALAIALAVANHTITGKIRVWIDDCDSIFMDTESLSVMKGTLDEDRNVFAWGKNMTNQIAIFENSNNEFDQLKAAALRACQPKGFVGVEVPTDRMHFIITSNRFLTPPNPSSNLTTRRKMDEATIRDRLVYHEYKHDKNDSWGWVASVLINSKTLGLNASQKHILLDWMYTNWDNLAATSMRAIKDLVADMLNYPKNYPDYWSMRLMNR